MPPDPTIFIVDDEPEMRRSLKLLFKAAGCEARTFASAEEFLERYAGQRPGCLVLDVRLGGMSGLELQSQLAARGVRLPIVMISAHADVSRVVSAVKAGARDFLEKPFSDEALLGRVRTAIREDAEVFDAQADRHVRLSRLTHREREVMELLVAGKSIKQIAHQLGVSAQTAAKHRVRVLEKMQVEGDVELVRFLLADEDGAS